MNAIGYVRVSTIEQAQEGVSLAAQEAQITAYCTAKGWNLVRIARDDGVSAKTLKRPGIQAVLEALDRHEAEVLIVTKLDRLSRSVRDILDLVDKRFVHNGAALCSLAESLDATTAVGRFALTLFAALAELERGKISERTKDALAYKRTQGDHQGNIPYGWKAAPGDHKHRDRWVRDEAAQQVIAYTAELRKAGSFYEYIAFQLNEQQLRPLPAGATRWTRTNVANILRKGGRSP